MVVYNAAVWDIYGSASINFIASFYGMLAVANCASSVAQLTIFLPNFIVENVNYIQISIPMSHVDESIFTWKDRKRSSCVDNTIGFSVLATQ